MCAVSTYNRIGQSTIILGGNRGVPTECLVYQNIVSLDSGVNYSRSVKYLLDIIQSSYL